MINYPTKTELFSIIAKTEFKPFDGFDWDCFAGCESENPLIGTYNDFVIVLDNDMINIVHSDDEYGGQLFELNQTA